MKDGFKGGSESLIRIKPLPAARGRGDHDGPRSTMKAQSLGSHDQLESLPGLLT